MKILDYLDEKWRSLIIVFDQAILSLLTFAITIIIVNDVGALDFGIYVIIFTGVTLCVTLFNALVINPLSVIIPKRALSSVGIFYGSLNIYQGVISISLSAFFMLIGYLGVLMSGDLSYAKYLPAAFLASLFQMNYVYLKATLLAVYRYSSCLVVDITYVSTYIALLLYFHIQSYGDITFYFYAMACASFTASLVALYLNNPIISLACDGSKGLVKEIFDQGRWLTGVSLMAWIRSNLATYVSLFFLGPLAPAVIKIGQTIFGPLNIIYLSMNSFLPQLGSKLYHLQGVNALSAFLFKVMSWLLLGATLYQIAIFFYLEKILLLMSNGEEFIPYSVAIMIVGLQTILIGPVEVMAIGNRVLGKAQDLFRAYFFEIILSSVPGILLVQHFDVNGLAIWRVISSLVICILIFLLFKRNTNYVESKGLE